MWLRSNIGEHSFLPGMQVGAYPAFAGYGEVRVKSVAHAEVVLVATDGTERRMRAVPGEQLADR